MGAGPRPRYCRRVKLRCPGPSPRRPQPLRSLVTKPVKDKLPDAATPGSSRPAPSRTALRPTTATCTSHRPAGSHRHDPPQTPPHPGPHRDQRPRHPPSPVVQRTGTVRSPCRAPPRPTSVIPHAWRCLYRAGARTTKRTGGIRVHRLKCPVFYSRETYFRCSTAVRSPARAPCGLACWAIAHASVVAGIHHDRPQHELQCAD